MGKTDAKKLAEAVVLLQRWHLDHGLYPMGNGKLACVDCAAVDAPHRFDCIHIITAKFLEDCDGMTKPIEFFIPVQVLPKQSFRHGKGHAYTPARITDNAGALVIYARGHRPDEPFVGPVIVSYQFCFRTPKGMSLLGLKETIPDLGNLEKQMDDVLQAAGFFARGDQQIARREVSEKVWTDREGVRVRIWAAEK